MPSIDLLSTACAALEEPRTSNAIKQCAAEALLAAVHLGLSPPSRAAWLIWSFWTTSPASRSWRYASKLGELPDEHVRQEAIAILASEDAGDELRDLAVDVLVGGAYAAHIDDRFVLAFIERAYTSERVQGIARIIEAVHSARGIDLALLRSVRDRWATSAISEIREASITIANEIGEPDMVFVERMLADPSVEVRAFSRIGSEWTSPATISLCRSSRLGFASRSIRGRAPHSSIRRGASSKKASRRRVVGVEDDENGCFGPFAMSHIANDEMVRLRQEVSLQRLVEARGVKLRRDHDKLVGTCPFHEDLDQALVVDLKANTWICSSCAVTDGTAVEWTMKAEGISRRHAIQLLRGDHAGGGGGKIVKTSTAQKLPELIAGDVNDAKLLEQVVAYYADTLKITPVALDFVAKNGIGAEAIERFRMGVSDRTLGYRIPKTNRKAGTEVRGRLQQLGLLRDTGHESLRGCITVPLFDESGAVVSVYGRRIDDRGVESADLYVSTKGLFNIEALRTSREIVVCSSVFDAVILWGHGVHVVTAVHDGNVDELVAAIVKNSIAKVTICFSRTDEGQKRGLYFQEKISAAEVEVFRALLPTGMDVQSFATSSSSPMEAIGTVIRQAEWIGGVRPRNPSPSTASVIAPAANTTKASSTTTNTGDIIMDLGDRRWRIRGLGNNLSYERLRVHVFVSRETTDSRTSGFFVDTIELYSARHRNAFVEHAAEELGLDTDVVKKDLGHVLLRLEAMQDEQIRAALQPEKVMPTMTDAEGTAAMDLLRDPKLIDRIVADFERCGVVGENDNRVVGYLAATSRKLPHPLAIVVQSSSGSGKSSLMQAVLDFIPEEERRSFSALTGQSIFYMGEAEIAHKVLSITEEEGAARASYALKVLQSEGVLTIASTAKEAGTGRLVTHEYRVQGPVAIFTTTTAIDVDEELISRCIVLAVDERPEQTRAIHERQRQAQTLDALFARMDRDAVLQLHRNAQRLLRPIAIVNPLASELAFPDHRVRARRDHQKYLGLIEAITLLHQHQRPVKTAERNGVVVEYIEVTHEDLALADRLIATVVSRALDDLPPMTKRMLMLLDVMVRESATKQKIEPADIRFTRREVRERLGVGSTQAWTHLRRLIDGEYVLVHPSRRGRGVVFELALQAARTMTNSGAQTACSGVHSGDVRAHEKAPLPEKEAPELHRSVSARSHTGEKRGSARRTSSSNGAR